MKFTGKRANCPRCTGALIYEGMVRCDACGSVWLDKTALDDEWHVKNKANGYVEQEFVDGLEDLVAVSQISTLRETGEYLETALGLRREALEALPKKDGAAYFRLVGELETLRAVIDWINRQADTIETERTKKEEVEK